MAEEGAWWVFSYDVMGGGDVMCGRGLTQDGKTGGDDADAGLDGGPYKDACERISRVEMSDRHQFDRANYGGGADTGERRNGVSKLSSIKLSSNNAGVG